MRRILSLVLCVLLLSIMTVTAFAEEAKQNRSDTAASMEQTADTSAEPETEDKTSSASSAPADAATTEPTNKPTDEPTNEPSNEPIAEQGELATVTLILDNETVYDGMSSAYKNGYTPTISNNTAIVCSGQAFL